MSAANSSDPNYDIYLSIIQSRTYWISLAVFGFILDVLIIAGNSVLLYAIYKDPRNSLRTPPGLLVANLSVADLLLGLFNVSLVAIRDVYRSELIHMPSLAILKAVMYTVLTTTLFVSSNTIIAMSVTCYVAISSPMEYKAIITKKRIKIYFAVLWVMSLGTCVLPVTSVSEETYTMIYLHTHATIPAILLTVVYVKVFRALARRTRELQQGGYDKMATKSLERERTMAFAVVTILALFYITYIPQYITLHLLYFCKPCQESLTFHEIDVALSRFLFLNSAINPFVYSWRVPKYRQALRDCWRSCRGQPYGITAQGSVSQSSQMNTSRIAQNLFLSNTKRTQTDASEITSL
ncbi:adenosine receptor A2a-like [Montipora capricornis]|uniref:adenosine receptor A2a-like n=1 Tax=Montipora capricornis TaxID=246305 RepID=UPI0035F1E9F5